MQILLLAQHVSGTTMPIIRSSRVLYSVEQAIRSAIKTSVASSWHFISTDLFDYYAGYPLYLLYSCDIKHQKTSVKSDVRKQCNIAFLYTNPLKLSVITMFIARRHPSNTEFFLRTVFPSHGSYYICYFPGQLSSIPLQGRRILVCDIQIEYTRCKLNVVLELMAVSLQT